MPLFQASSSSPANPWASSAQVTRWSIGVLLALLISQVYAATSSVNVQRADAAVHVQASAVVQANAATTWNTLVGYDQLPTFIPDMTLSKTLQRNGDSAVVEQRGRAGLGPFKQGFTLTLEVQEEHLKTVQAKALAGDFSRFESSYRIEPQGDGRTRIDYTAWIEPKAGIPPLVGVPAMRIAIRRQFDALLTEIERRAAVPTPLALQPRSGVTP